MTKFKIGDATDRKQCIAIQHEFLRADEAFQEFAATAEYMIRTGEDRSKAYKTYNAYARFVHHLYEFALGAIARDLQDTQPLKHPKLKEFEMAERLITSIVQRILTRRREAILNGTAPSWENSISAYPEKVPVDFARDFRSVHNTASGHVKHQRADLSLTDFYRNYHKYLYMLHFESKHMWGTLGDEFPDLGEITAFSMMLKKQPPQGSS